MYVRRVYWAAAAACVSLAVPPYAQSTEPQTHQHAPAPAATSSWRRMQDGVIYGLFNDQGGPRGGGPEFVVPNWWMGVWAKEHGTDQFGVNAMLSLDPATVGAYGYGEIFQAGETFDGKPLIDRQHPHDLLMQLAGTWRRTFSAPPMARGPCRTSCSSACGCRQERWDACGTWYVARTST